MQNIPTPSPQTPQQVPTQPMQPQQQQGFQQPTPVTPAPPPQPPQQAQPVSAVQQPTKRKGCSFLVIVLVLLVILLIGAAVGAYLLLTKDDTKNGENGAEANTCTYNGTIHQDGASFDADDGCNTCTCENGTVSCTEMACQPVEGDISVEGKTYQEAFQTAQENVEFVIFVPTFNTTQGTYVVKNDKITIEKNTTWKEDGKVVTIVLINEDDQEITFTIGEYAAGGACGETWEITNPKIGDFIVCELRGFSSSLRDLEGYHYEVFFDESFTKNEVNEILEQIDYPSDMEVTS